MYFLKRNSNNSFIDEMNNFFTDSFKSYTKELKADVSETENDYQIDIDVPGVDKKDINLNVEDNYLTISVNKEASKEEKNKKYIRKERYYSNASRSFYVGNVDKATVKAKLNNGILTIVVPKVTTEPEKKYIQIE